MTPERRKVDVEEDGAGVQVAKQDGLFCFFSFVLSESEFKAKLGLK